MAISNKPKQQAATDFFKDSKKYFLAAKKLQ